MFLILELKFKTFWLCHFESHNVISWLKIYGSVLLKSPMKVMTFRPLFRRKKGIVVDLMCGIGWTWKKFKIRFSLISTFGCFPSCSNLLSTHRLKILANSNESPHFSQNIYFLLVHSAKWSPNVSCNVIGHLGGYVRAYNVRTQ